MISIDVIERGSKSFGKQGLCPETALQWSSICAAHGDDPTPISRGRTARTVLEQLHYEVHSFSSCVTPDVIAEFRHERVEQAGEDRVRVTGLVGRERPATLKVLLGYHAGYDVRSERLRHFPNNVLDSVYLYNDLPRAAALKDGPQPRYVEFRYSAIVRDRAEAEYIARSFMGFYLNGAYGGVVAGLRHDNTASRSAA